MHPVHELIVKEIFPAEESFTKQLIPIEMKMLFYGLHSMQNSLTRIEGVILSYVI